MQSHSPSELVYTLKIKKNTYIFGKIILNPKSDRSLNFNAFRNEHTRPIYVNIRSLIRPHGCRLFHLCRAAVLQPRNYRGSVEGDS